MNTIEESQNDYKEEEGFLSRLSLREEEAQDDDDSLPELEEEELQADVANNNGLWFTGGPVWHYPEEEIEFFSADEGVDSTDERDFDFENEQEYGYEYGYEYNSEYNSDYGSHYVHGLDEFRDEISDGNRLCGKHSTGHPVLCSIRARDEKKRRRKPKTKPKRKMSASYDGSATHKRSSGDKLGVNRNDVASASASAPASNTRSSKSNRKAMDRTKRRLRLRERGSGGKGHSIPNPKGQEQHFKRFRETALRLPFEYTSKLATICVRRPYGIDAPEIFRVLAPDTTDREYGKQAHPSFPQTIQVAITIGADKSLMLLYGAAGVRYKKDTKDQNWTDVRDVGALDVPLGYVKTRDHTKRGRTRTRSDTGIIEYSLDEVLEEAMLVREQYCTSLLTAALNPDQYQPLETEMEVEMEMETETTPTKASPPSLAKSIVSTPPRSDFYYDGSNSGSGQNSSYQDHVDDTFDEEDGAVRKRLDFVECLSPSAMSTTRTIETSRTSQLGGKSLEEKMRRRKRRKAYRICQKVIIVIGFYCSGIFLVASLSGVDNERLVNILAIVFPSSLHNNVIESWFVIDTTAEEPLQDTEGTDAGESAQNGFTPKRRFHISELFASTASKGSMELQCRQSLALALNETSVYKEKLEEVEQSLALESRQIRTLSEQYHSEHENTETLLREKEKATALVQQFSHKAETLAIDLELEQEQRRKLEERITSLERDIVDLRKREQVFNDTLATRTVSSGSTTNNAAADRDETLENRMEQDITSHYLRRKNTTETSSQRPSFANISPIWPKLHRQVSEHFGIVEEEESSTSASASTSTSTRNHAVSPKFEQFEAIASSLKEALGEGVKKVFKARREETGNGHLDSTGEPSRDRLARTRVALASLTESIRQVTVRLTDISLEAPASPIFHQSMQPRLVESGTDRPARTREALATVAESIRRATIRTTESFFEVPGSAMHLQSMQPKLVEPGTVRLARAKEALVDIAESMRQATIRATERFIEAPASPVLQSMKPRLTENTDGMKRKLTASTNKALKQSKEGSKIVRQQVTKNVEVATIAGIAKLDRGQEAIHALGDFAREKLGIIKQRVAVFASNKWGKRDSQGSKQGLRDLTTTHYYKGFAGRRKGGVDSGAV